jgi:ERCC4-type nuclease
MVVIADDRENEKLLHKLFISMGNKAQRPDGQVEVRRLQVGDYIIGDIGIEAKEINDLWKSILGIGRTRTIYAQLSDLCENYEKPMLIVYGGEVKTYRPPGFKRGNVRAEIARAHSVIKAFKKDLFFRFPKIQYMQLDTMEDFVSWIGNAHTQQQIAGRLTQPDKIRHARRSSVDPRVLALSGLPGVTENQALEILQRFGSIPELLKSKVTQSQLMEIQGIGRTKAKRILTLREKWHPRDQ